METWVYLPSPECKNHKHKHSWIKHLKHHHKCKWHCKHRKCTCKPLLCHFCPLCWENQFKRGSLLERPGSYELEIGKHREAVFTLYTEKPKNKRCTVTQKNTVQSPAQLPLDEWVHLAAVYDGTNVVLYVNGEAQPGQKQTTGNVKDLPVPLLLGCEGFHGIMEEARISNCARTLCASSFGMRHEGENPFGASFGGGGNGGTITQTVSRTTFYNGWQKIEERETVTQNGQTGEEKIVRQFVDSASIDEHLCVDYYNEAGTAIEKTYFYHANYRGDTVALTDASGNAMVKMEYSAYGQGFAIDAQGQLQPLGEEMIELVGYLFQGRELDAETGNYYFRNRYYNAEMGRFVTRDPLGYVDSMGLYEAMGGNAYRYGDPFGNIWLYHEIKQAQQKKPTSHTMKKGDFLLITHAIKGVVTESMGKVIDDLRTLAKSRGISFFEVREDDQPGKIHFLQKEGASVDQGEGYLDVPPEGEKRDFSKKQLQTFVENSSIDLNASTYIQVGGYASVCVLRSAAQIIAAKALKKAQKVTFVWPANALSLFNPGEPAESLDCHGSLGMDQIKKQLDIIMKNLVTNELVKFGTQARVTIDYDTQWGKHTMTSGSSGIEVNIQIRDKIE